MQSNPLSIFFYVVLIFISFSCKNLSFEKEETLWTYLKDERNGYTQNKTINGVQFSLMYKPTDLLVIQELTDEETSEELVNSLREKYDQYLYFSLSIARKNQELLNSVAHDKARFGGLMKQLAFGMQNKIHLYTGKKDTVSMADYIYPRMYGMSKHTTLLLIYDREKLTDAKTLNLTIEDLGFGTGEVRFTQEIDKIKNAPGLQL